MDYVYSESSAESAKEYSEEDLFILSHVINGEAECGSMTLKMCIGSVVLNRVADDRYPDTIKDVVFEEGQYACVYDGNYDKEPTKESVEAAKKLLKYGSRLPRYVIFEAEFEQGDSTYSKIETPISTIYFCYWEADKNRN